MTGSGSGGQSRGRAKRDVVGEWFNFFACKASAYAGKPVAFLFALATVLVWAASGPLFGFSETWQLVINTSTTIVTFLMVFLIQHAQNTDTAAVQLKLAELIVAVKGANNLLVDAEYMSEDELDAAKAEVIRKAKAEAGPSGQS